MYIQYTPFKYINLFFYFFKQWTVTVIGAIFQNKTVINARTDNDWQ